MAELSGRTGVPIPTIKFYLREGLLPPGERTSPNQAGYDDGHVRRLALIRALLDVGGLSVAAARAVLGHVDAPEIDTFTTLGKVQYALLPHREPAADRAWREAAHQVQELVRRRGWQIRPRNPAFVALTDAVAVLRRMGQDDVLGILDRYADAAHLLAGEEVEIVRSRTAIEGRAEGVVILAVLGDALFTALRRLAQEDHVARWPAGERQASTSGDDASAQ